MAAGVDLRLNHVLCFLFTKLHKCDVRFIKQAILDYFLPGDIHEAKEVFLSYVSTLNNVESLSKIRARRGDDRTEHELDDIFTVITELDEKQTLSQLPTFVSDSAEKMPSKSIVEGDMRAIMNRFGKMEQQILHLQSTINQLTSEMAAIVASQSLVNRQRDQHSSFRTSVNSPVDSPTCDHQRSTASQSKASLVKNVENVNKSNVTDRTRLSSADQMQSRPNKRWSDAHYSSASASCDDRLYLEDTWQEASSRKRRKTKTKTQGVSPSITNSSKNDPQTSNAGIAADVILNAKENGNCHNPEESSAVFSYSSVTKAGKQKPTMIVGKKISDSKRDRVIAAKPYVGKAVFCIDNVSRYTDVADIITYINDLGVDVISCFQAQPRRSQWQRSHGIIPQDRIAFRVCIPREQTDKLLDPNAWPAHISLTAWRFSKLDPTTRTDFSSRTATTGRIDGSHPVSSSPSAIHKHGIDERDGASAVVDDSAGLTSIHTVVASSLVSIHNNVVSISNNLTQNEELNNEINEVDLSNICVDMDKTIVTNFDEQ
jgi:hypothetical protein